MAKQVKLSAQVRPGVGRSAVNHLKKKGIVPAVIYGGKTEAQPLQVAARDIKALLSHAVGENFLVELEIDNAGSKATRMALIQEVQHAPLSGDVLHVDFHAVNMNEKLTASIPIEPTGEASGVKNFGGILEQSLRSLEIECLPGDLPEIIRINVSGLNIGDSIHVKHIQLPDGVVALDDADLTVFLCAEPKVEEEPAAASETPAQPEVIKEKKEEPAADEKEKK